MRTKLLIIFVVFLAVSCKENPPIEQGELQLVSISVGTDKLSFTENNTGFPFDQPLVVRFAQALSVETIESNISLLNNDNTPVSCTFSYLDGDQTVSMLPGIVLDQNASYFIAIGSGLKGKKEESFPGITVAFTTGSLPLEINEIFIDGKQSQNGSRITNVSFRPEIKVQFSEKVPAEFLENNISVSLGSLSYTYLFNFINDSLVQLNVSEDLPAYRMFRLKIYAALGEDMGKEFDGVEQEFYTQLDSTDKFPRVSDEELLDIVQEQTFKYFWDFAHPVSGLNRERNTSDDNVTSGGSGFGVMCIPLGIERGYITREEGIDRLSTIVDFLGKADRFHGAWSHWLSGSTGKVNPFSADDDGGDLVETSYMAMGLLTARQYLNEQDAVEADLIIAINALLDSIEWDWYTQGENSLTWHWSPRIGFEKNMKIRGWNEALITYIMAASSNTHGISKSVYEEGWGGGVNMINGKSFYDITLPLGRDYGGPLFFEQYTFLGLDPRNLNDQFASYCQQATNHSLINREYCITNPNNYVGYSEACWGLTASDGNLGYSAHSPSNDRGVISPTAAISSIPFTPEYSMDAIRHFYYLLGDKLWGPYGFYDAFNVTANWYASSNIAIDQGPIILMIENYRTALLWDLFMSAPEIQNGLTKLGFTF